MKTCKRCHNPTRATYCEKCKNDVFEQQRITNYKPKEYEKFGEI